MNEKSIAILSIATGRYIIFWEEFFKSSEKFFVTQEGYRKEYYVFTDAAEIAFEESPRVHKIYQEALPWPYISLDRFSIFQKARSDLKKMDYIFFFNANMLFVNEVLKEFLPDLKKPLLMVEHQGFVRKPRAEFTYDTNKKSLAYIGPDEGFVYVMGGLNGGCAREYLELIDELQHRIDIDKANQVMPLWHDESHLNRYCIDNFGLVKLRDPSYGVFENWDTGYVPKIIIRDKKNYGGVKFLRNEKIGVFNWLKSLIKRKS